MARGRSPLQSDFVGSLVAAAVVLSIVVAGLSKIASEWRRIFIDYPFGAPISLAVSMSAIGALVWMAVRGARRAENEEAKANLGRERQLQERMSVVAISESRFDYVISNEDYRRGTPRENFYRKHFFLQLLATFGNCCVACGNSQNGVDIDHLVFSKNEGGSFAMFHREGYWVNNAVPLCHTCNRSKVDKSYRDFFSPDRLLSILERNVEMTRRLNAAPEMKQFKPNSPQLSGPA